MEILEKKPVIGIYDKNPKNEGVTSDVFRAFQLEIQHLREGKVYIFKDFIECKTWPNTSNKVYFFLVHLDLSNPNYDRYGIIELLREEFPGAYISAYSAGGDATVEEECRKRGAFFVKWSIKDWEKIIFAWKMRMKEHFETANTKAIAPTAQYYCRVLEVFEDKVLLHVEDAKDRNQKTERYFRINRFKGIGIDKLKVDFPVLLSLYENIDEEGTTTTQAIFTEGDDSFFPLPKVDWNFLENREVEIFQSERRSD